MIKYRPQKGSLAEALKSSKEFSTVEEMYAFIISEWNEFSGIILFMEEDLSIGENLGRDTRTNWKETRYVCTKRMGDTIYEVPQCIGMCSFE